MAAPVKSPKSVLISRTDSIGDVMLTLPLAKAIKEKYPSCRIYFLGRSYTKAVITACEYVDDFIDVSEYVSRKLLWTWGKPTAIIHVFPQAAIARRAKALKTPIRIGTINRLYHWFTCNRLVRLSRKNSDLHESQLNFALLKPLGIDLTPSLDSIGNMYGFTNVAPLQPEWQQVLEPGKYHLILHPKSQGSAREWGLDNFQSLIHLLDPSRYQIFISGTEAERPSLQPLLDACKGRVVDIIGKMDLTTFISFISKCDGLVSASTGPLHIAAALGKKAIGIYPPIRPMHPGRWAPIGPRAVALSLNKSCNDCLSNPTTCHCIREITPTQVASHL